MGYYPVFLDLRGRRCAVLGGGRTATEKVLALLEAGAEVFVVAPSVTAGLRRLAAQGRIGLARREYKEGDLEGAWLAVDATWNEGVNARSHAEAETCRLILNVVDRPRHCDFIAPAVVRRGSLQLAISTGGESPYLASVLRGRLESQFGPEWGPFTALVGRVRGRLRRRGVPAAEQRRIYARLLASDVRSLLRRGRVADAERAAAAIESESLAIEPETMMA